MTKPSKISLTIFLLALAGLSFYAFVFFQDRDAAPKINRPTNSTQITQPSDQANENSSGNATVDNSAADSTDEPSIVANENAPAENNNFLDVSKTDCSNLCKDFTDPDDLKYCQQICGLTPIKTDIKEKKSCDVLNDLEKDYCLKDLAISTKDVRICSEISDTDIKNVCKNRIAQDFLESQK